ncbi:MAG TPA: phage tail protein [Nitrosomonas sp.]|nr:phage tail protein [Nitrosomonas sp.]HMW21410.1 phage tail protein [Nitrosomonas sp.]HMW69281.1 phage tail protein [Nitrosomonas sp.]HND36634.1 phage tail protein [Nitrosomonas sp.]HNE57934.1 phage tail protein [Nitrosomonas sp.]
MARVDPYKNFRFLLEIDGITQAGFSDCSGFGSNVEVVEYREGGEAPTVRKLPGKTSYPDITLKWGITDSRDLYDWHLSAINGNLVRKNGSIILQDDLGQEKVRWNFFTAWPSKYDGPDLSAKGNDVAIDTLTISCERLVRA